MYQHRRCAKLLSIQFRSPSANRPQPRLRSAFVFAVDIVVIILMIAPIQQAVRIVCLMTNGS